MEFEAYFGMTKFYDKLIIRIHIDFEKCKTDLMVKEFALQFASSFANFHTYVSQEFLIFNLYSNTQEE